MRSSEGKQPKGNSADPRSNFRATIERGLRKAVRNKQGGGLTLFEVLDYSALENRFGPIDAQCVMQLISSDLRKRLRGGADTLIQVNKNTFAIVSNFASGDTMRTIAQRTKDRIAGQIYELDGRTIRIETAFGYATFGKYDCYSSIIKRARGAMIKANTAGDNKVLCWDVARLAA